MSEESNWPPRFTLTPKGTAGLYLKTLSFEKGIGGEDQVRLATILEEYWTAGFNAAKKEKK